MIKLFRQKTFAVFSKPQKFFPLIFKKYAIKMVLIKYFHKKKDVAHD